MQTKRPITRSNILATVLLGSFPLGLLSGCGVGILSTTPGTPANVMVGKIQGGVHGGQQPVVGATIQLYEVGTTGYATAPATPILPTPVTTDASGSFNLTGLYTCDSNTYVYITAAGGNPGAGNNPQLALMAALGPCAGLGSSTFISINEVTTVAAAYAMAQFSANSTFGTALSAAPGSKITAAAPADNFSTSSTNIQGIANAMATAQVLASTSTGTSPGNNTNQSAKAEYWQVNTVADILAACVNSTGGVAGDLSTCGTLFSNVPKVGGIAPADTIQAALALALTPTVSNTAISSLYGLITPTPPFVPFADANSVADFSIGITYTPVVPSTTTTLLNAQNQIAFDSVGNAWITNTGTGFPVVEVDPTGNPVQAGSGTGLYKITNYNIGTTPTSISGGGGSTVPYSLALDTADNPWVTDQIGNALFKITGSGGLVGGTNGGGASPTAGGAALGYSLNTTPGTGSAPTAVAVDGSNNVWFTLKGGVVPGGTCGAYTTGNKALGGFLVGAYGTFIQGGPDGSNPYAIAIDGGGTYDSTTPPTTAIPGAPFIWTINGSSGSGGPGGHYGTIGQFYSTGSSLGCSTPLSFIAAAATASQTTLIPSINPSGSDAINLSGNPVGLAIDHSGDLWIVNDSFVDASSTIKYSVTKLVPNYGSVFTAAQADTSFSFQNFAVGTGGALSTFNPYYLGIDGAGNVWVSGSSGAIVELSNAGTTLSPAAGYTGSTTNTGANKLVLTGSKGVAIDLSGNVWITNGTAGSAGITVLVGAAAPVVSPLSIAIKNNTLGTKP